MLLYLSTRYSYPYDTLFHSIYQILSWKVNHYLRGHYHMTVIKSHDETGTIFRISEKWCVFVGLLFTLKKRIGGPIFCVLSLLPVMNSTAQSAIQELYSGIDFSSLNWLEHQWAAWYIWVGNPVIATGVLAFVVHEVSLAFKRDDVNS